MHDLAHYRNRHTDLLQMIEDLQQLLTPEMLRIRPNAKTAYLLLCELAARSRSI